MLPAARTIVGGRRDLLETVTLDPSLAEAMTAAAQAAGPGAHALTVAAGAVPGPMPDPLDGWALAQELLGVDLPLDSAGRLRARCPEDPPAPVGHAVRGAAARHRTLPPARGCCTCARRTDRASGSSSTRPWAARWARSR